MPEQLLVIRLSTLLANSQYVKQSQYTPRRTRKRTRGVRSTVNATQKQSPGVQPAGTPVSLPGGSQQGVPGQLPAGTPQQPQFAPTHLVPRQPQHTIVPMQTDGHDAQRQQQEWYWQQQNMPPYWQQQGWYTPPPPPPEKPVDWAVLVVSFVVALICGVFAGCLFELFF
jgi:hypothetical protein